jgi:crotonobetainyl-CoA:carnitine CoA-transferase CaiB-like acyl-CoA transferase
VLSPYRVLDLTDPRAWLCGQVLAQLGAEVVTVEPPGGHDTGDLRPRWREAYLRGRVLLDGAPDRVADLATTADAVVATEASGVDLDALRADDPGLVTVSITPWGRTGPKAGWLGPDLVVTAASGHMMLNGDQDRPPIRVSEPQAFHHASSEAVVHLVAALVERRRSGLGQHIDVSAHHCMLQASQTQMLSSAVGADPPQRFGGGVRHGGYPVRLVYPAADGHVAVTFLFGDMIGRFTQRLMAWVHEEGHCRAEIRDQDYVRFFELIYGGQLDQALLTEASDAIARLTAGRTKAELLEAAMERNLLIAPVATAADTLAFDQFEARDYWERGPVEREGGAGGSSVRLPGPWVRATATPLRPLVPAGRPGVDNDRLARLRERTRPPLETAGPAGPTGVAGTTRPLDGVRILDFSWVLAGPLATRLLADLGATVVRIEHEGRPDVIRAAGPFLAGREGGDATALWHNASAGKHSLELDITTDGGREVVVDLARWADVAFESFSPGALDRLGLGPQVLRAANPRLVVASSSLLGQTGPRAGFAGFGNLAAALAGFFEVTGWPDRAPTGPFTAYTDYVSPRFAAAAMVAAVDHAQRTGQGQYLDIAQAEAAIHLLTPTLVAHQLDGVTATRLGNRDAVLVPHGAFPAGPVGEDRWIAIACTDDAWPALVELAGLPADWAGLDGPARRARVDDIEAALAAWTTGRDAVELTAGLQGAGVAAHAVQHSAEVCADPQLRHRGYLQRVDHARHGSVVVEGSQARWSRTQPGPAFGGPPVGQHTQFVLEELLGYDTDRIAELVVAGAIG